LGLFNGGDREREDAIDVNVVAEREQRVDRENNAGRQKRFVHFAVAGT
jgi:hypothetical protein